VRFRPGWLREEEARTEDREGTEVFLGTDGWLLCHFTQSDTPTRFPVSPLFCDTSPGTRTADGGEHGVEESRKKVVELFAPERVCADDSMRFHPDDTGFAKHLKMAGSSGFAEVQRNLTTVQAVGIGDGPDDLQPSRIAQSKEDTGKADLILSWMERLSHPNT
jgi:hypothetical protein